MSGLELEHASWARRVVALLIDWVASSLVTLAIVGSEHYSDRSANWLPLAVFLLESAFGTALAGGSFGQLVIRIRVFRTDGRQLSLLMALFRSFLICLVVPPLVFKPDDGRGLHDLWTSSAAYKI
ncbi:MAG: hypothetical protein JWR35_2000 [Marmoricola sp.]|jgi:uncharacterized RDD family membrane protein YckC|nr:hypothetical protein [Marmoricola sp.]